MVRSAFWRMRCRGTHGQAATFAEEDDWRAIFIRPWPRAAAWCPVRPTIRARRPGRWDPLFCHGVGGLHGCTQTDYAETPRQAGATATRAKNQISSS